MQTIIAILLIAACCACTPSATRDNVPDDREVAFSCANGESLNVHFYPARSVAVLMRNGASIELPQQRSGSGFIYSNGPNTIRGKGNDLIVEIGRMTPISCTAR
jgi:membrane-bound inhibitor of C-type lysozyme